MSTYLHSLFTQKFQYNSNIYIHTHIHTYIWSKFSRTITFDLTNTRSYRWLSYERVVDTKIVRWLSQTSDPPRSVSRFQLSNSGPAIIIGLIVIATQLVSLCCYRGPRNYLLSHVIAIVIVIGPRIILFPDRIDIRVFRGDRDKTACPTNRRDEWWMHG